MSNSTTTPAGPDAGNVAEVRRLAESFARSAQSAGIDPATAIAELSPASAPTREMRNAAEVARLAKIYRNKGVDPVRVLQDGLGNLQAGHDRFEGTWAPTDEVGK